MSLKKTFILFSLLSFIQITNALPVNDSIKKLIQKEKIVTKKVDLMVQLAISYNRKNTDSAIHYTNQALSKAQAINYSLGIADSYNSLAWANFRQSNYEKADSLCLKAIEYYQKNEGVEKKKSNSYRLLAAINIEEKRFDEALKHLLKVKDIYEVPNFENKESKINILKDIAYLYLEMDNYIMSMKYLNESIVSAKTNDNSTILADCYLILGTINSKQKNYTKAIEYLNLSKDIYTVKNDMLSLAGCNSKIGINHYNNKSYATAIEFLGIAKEQSVNISYNYGLMENLIYLGRSHTKLNNIKTAHSFLEKAKKIAKKHSIGTLEIIIAESDLAIYKGDYLNAVSLLENHLNTRSQTISPKAKIDLYHNLSKAYRSNRNFEKSLKAKDKLLQIQDSINNTQKVVQLNVLQAEFDYIKVKNDLRNKEAELQISEEKARSSRLTYMLLAIAATSLFIISTLIYIRRKETWKTKQELDATKQQKLDNEITFKNKQITDFALHISEKNDLLISIKEKIKLISLTEKTKNKNLNDLILFLNNNLEQNKEKVAIYSIADNTKDAFYHKLSELYPQLSVKEKRVAAFVRLNLTSKQIAIQQNISISSIDNYRYNLRKKMNVNKEITLNDFLKNI